MQISKKSFLIGLIIGTSFIFSCNRGNTDPAKISPTPTFIVSNNEEQMPVWVEGKADSDAVLLVVHGGPGSDVLDFRTYQNGLGFKEIEKSYLVAYWQQRAAGQSIGPDKKDYYTIAQYVDDCDKVIDQIKNKYPNKKIVLMGHSWGGMLTSSYLVSSTRKAKVSAWINAAGATNGTTLLQQTIDDVNAEANKRIAKNENVSYWQDIKNQLITNSNLANSLAYSCLDKVGEVTTKVNNSEFKFASRVNTSNPILFSEIVKTNNATQVSNFNIPTLLLWGKYDFAVSVKQRDEVISKIGIAKLINIEFDLSGHYMMFHEPAKFAISVVGFVGKL